MEAMNSNESLADSTKGLAIERPGTADEDLDALDIVRGRRDFKCPLAGEVELMLLIDDILFLFGLS